MNALDLKSYYQLAKLQLSEPEKFIAVFRIFLYTTILLLFGFETNYQDLLSLGDTFYQPISFFKLAPLRFWSQFFNPVVHIIWIALLLTQVFGFKSMPIRIAATLLSLIFIGFRLNFGSIGHSSHIFGFFLLIYMFYPINSDQRKANELIFFLRLVVPVIFLSAVVNKLYFAGSSFFTTDYLAFRIQMFKPKFFFDYLLNVSSLFKSFAFLGLLFQLLGVLLLYRSYIYGILLIFFHFFNFIFLFDSRNFLMNSLLAIIFFVPPFKICWPKKSLPTISVLVLFIFQLTQPLLQREDFPFARYNMFTNVSSSFPTYSDTNVLIIIDEKPIDHFNFSTSLVKSVEKSIRRAIKNKQEEKAQLLYQSFKHFTDKKLGEGHKVEIEVYREHFVYKQESVNRELLESFK